MATLLTALLAVAFLQAPGSAAVSLYEYYAPGGVVSSGLVAEGPSFTLNDKPLTILSGAFHYFRVHPDHWRDTLRKMRAGGLNTVETYVSWNLHEPRQGEYDFGALGEDKSNFLDVRTFVQIAQEEDLFVIFRPGPYICAEWDFGGMPSWLLRDPTMHVRTYYEPFRTAAQNFLNNLLPLVTDLQFTSGGPIISIQVENEYGHFGWDDEPRDLLYMEFIEEVILANGFQDSLLFTSDTPVATYDWGSLPGVFQTINFNSNAAENFAMLETLQPNRPKMVAEFWTGWFDHWLADVHTDGDVDDFANLLEYILTQNSSVNMYMFIGGTNFGFMAGANTVPTWPHYAPIVTSYDYGAPLSEAGDYTEKYNRMLEIFSRLNPLNGIVDNPSPPAERIKNAYGVFPISDVIDFPSLVAQAPESFESLSGTQNMEALPLHGNNGQSYGYILYTTSALVRAPESTLLVRGHVRDMAQVLVDNVVRTSPYGGLADVSSFGFWNARDANLTLPGTGTVARIDILVENLGRNNYGEPHKFVQKKGLWEGPILLDEQQLLQWTMTPLEFTTSFVNGLSGWSAFTAPLASPAVYRASVAVAGEPQDTFLDMSAWGKGCVFVNGFNLGRYWSEGPTRTLYVPAPLLYTGDNEVVIFEQYEAGTVVSFIDYPILGEREL